MSLISTYSVFNPITKPDMKTVYTDITALQTFTNVATNNVCAFYDVDNVPQSLLLGASSNVNIESVTNANVYVQGTLPGSSGFNVFHTDIVGNMRYDSNAINIGMVRTNNVNTTIFTANDKDNNMRFLFSNVVQFNSTTLTTAMIGESSRDHFSTNSANGFQFDNPVSFASNVEFQQNIVTLGSIFGSNLNVWSTRTANASTDLNQIGYGFRVNSENELELIKMATFGESGDVSSPVCQRIAIFGGNTNQLSRDQDNSKDPGSNYLVFNSLNGVSIAGNGQVVQTNSSAANALANAIFIYGQNIGIGTQTASYKLEVQGDGYFSQNLTANGLLMTNGGIVTSGEIQPLQDNSCDVGHADYMFANVFGKQIYYSSNTFITKINNVATFSNALTNSLQSLSCSNIIFGTKGSQITLKGDNDQVSFVNSSGTPMSFSGVVTISDPTQTSESSVASIKAVNVVYNSNISLSNAFYAGNYTQIPVRVNSINGSNATFSNVSASNVTVYGADFAEYMYKSQVSDSFTSGEIVGIDINGKITKQYSASYHFMVISACPGIIAGGSEENKSLQETVGYCGRVKVNCDNAQVGQDVVPYEAPDGTIMATSISNANITFEQYRLSVGRIISVDSYGVPTVVLKSA